MAVIINQSPTLPNGTQADVIYTLQSVSSSAPQFKYVCEIKDDIGNILTQIKQVPNNSGYGVFEVSKLLDDHMSYDTPWLIEDITNSTNNNIRNFEIVFGEEFGTSVSSSLVQEINVSASLSSSTTFIPAVQERDSGMFNWDSGSYDVLTNNSNVVGTINQGTKQSALIVSSSDYMTLSSLNIIASKGTLDSFIVNVYNNNLTSIYDQTFNNTNYTADVVANKLLHIPAGIPNLTALSSTLGTNINANPYYSIKVNYSGGSSDYHLFENKECAFYEGRNFAFINKLGVFDYYRATLVDRQRESFNRKTYKAPYVNYSTTNGVVDYSYSRRGETQYYASFENKFEVETDWLSTEQSNWLFELFESPNVFVQQGNNFIGIVIENANEEYRTNPAGQRMFKYTIKYRLSNPKRSRT
jgi:hypothetical protein